MWEFPQMILIGKEPFRQREQQTHRDVKAQGVWLVVWCGSGVGGTLGVVNAGRLRAWGRQRPGCQASGSRAGFVSQQRHGEICVFL